MFTFDLLKYKTGKSFKTSFQYYNQINARHLLSIFTRMKEKRKSYKLMKFAHTTLSFDFLLRKLDNERMYSA